MDLKPIIDISELQNIRSYHYTIQGLLSSDPDGSKSHFDGDFLGLHRASDPLISATPRAFDPPDSPVLESVRPDNVFSIARCLGESSPSELTKEPPTPKNEPWSPQTPPATHHNGKRKQRRYRYRPKEKLDQLLCNFERGAMQPVIYSIYWQRMKVAGTAVGRYGTWPSEDGVPLLSLLFFSCL